MKYGIFGGSFNPPHNEHKEICKRVKDSLSLDKIVILPCGNAPHKTQLLSFETRCEMISILFEGQDYILDRTENELDGLTNSARILPILKEKYGDITFIIGGDSMIDMDTWIEPEKVMTTCPIAVVARGEKSERLCQAIEKYEKIGVKIHVVDYVGKEVSSTMIRTYASLSIYSPFVPYDLSCYIRDNGLYKNYESVLKKLEARLTAERFRHTKYVAIMAVRLNEQLGLPYNKVMLSALLHDNAKYSAKKETTFGDLICKGAYAHAFVGAEEAKSDFGIEDEDILNAIRFHTTGKPNMTLLEKLIYLADLIEDTRDFEGVQKLRELALNDFDSGFKEALKQQKEHLKGKKDISSLTEECYNYYIIENNN